MSYQLKADYTPKHKTANIVFLCIFILFLFTSLTLDPEVPASESDLFFYRLSGAMLWPSLIFGLLANLDVFGMKKNIPLLRSEKKGHRVLFWLLLVLVSFILFSVFRSFTGEEFRKALEEAENTPETETVTTATSADNGNGSVSGTGSAENTDTPDTDSPGSVTAKKSGSAHVASPDSYDGVPNVLKPKTR